MLLKIIKKIKNRILLRFLTPEELARKLGVIVGKDCAIATKNFGSEPYLIEIGNNVQITGGVKFTNHGGGWVLRHKYPDFDFFGKIKIGNNVYIGNDVLIMAGVTIGNNVIIGAGSVVSKSIADNSVAVGNPIRVVTTIESFEEKYSHFNVSTKKLSKDEKRKFLLELPDHFFVKK